MLSRNRSPHIPLAHRHDATTGPTGNFKVKLTITVQLPSQTDANAAVTTAGVGIQPFVSTSFVTVTGTTPLGAPVSTGYSIGAAKIYNRDTTAGSTYSSASKVEIVLSFDSKTTDIAGTAFTISYDCGALRFGPLATAATGGGCTFGAPNVQIVRIGWVPIVSLIQQYTGSGLAREDVTGQWVDLGANAFPTWLATTKYSPGDSVTWYDATPSTTAVTSGATGVITMTLVNNVNLPIFTPGAATGTFAVGMVLTGTGISAGTTIVKPNDASSWVVSISQTVTSTTIKGRQPGAAYVCIIAATTTSTGDMPDATPAKWRRTSQPPLVPINVRLSSQPGKSMLSGAMTNSVPISAGQQLLQSWQNLELEHIFGTPYSSIAAAGAGTFPTSIAAAAEVEPVNAFTQPQNVYSRAAFVDATTGKLVTRYGQQTKSCDNTCAAPVFDPSSTKKYCGTAYDSVVGPDGFLYRCNAGNALTSAPVTWATVKSSFTKYSAWVSGFAYTAAGIPVLSFGVAYVSLNAVTSTVDPATDTYNWKLAAECSASPFSPTINNVYVSGASTFISKASYSAWSAADTTAAGTVPVSMLSGGLVGGTYPIGSKVTNSNFGQSNVYSCVNTASTAAITITTGAWSIVPVPSSNTATLLLTASVATTLASTMTIGTVISGPGITPGTVVLSGPVVLANSGGSTWIVSPSQSASASSTISGTLPCLAADVPGVALSSVWQQIDASDQQARIDWTCSPGKSVTLDMSTAPTYVEVSFKPTLLSQAGNYDVVISSMAFLRGGDFAPSAQTVFNVKSGFRIRPSFVETTGYDRENARSDGSAAHPPALRVHTH